MGQKIHPYGYRVGITQPHSARWFANTYQYPQYVFEDFLLRQSLLKSLPVENLPRKRTEDKAETKLVQIKIERLIRNTIKIKLYMTSPETASDLFDDNSNKFNKKDFGNTKRFAEGRFAHNEQKPSDSKKEFSSKERNLLCLNIQKKLLTKKLLKLQILKLQNMQYKLLTIKNLADGAKLGKSKVVPAFLLKMVGKKEATLAQQTQLQSKTIFINSSVLLSFIHGIKNCLDMNLEPANKIKYVFYFLKFKIQLCNNLLQQLELFQNLEKQKLVNYSSLNQSTEELQAFQSTIDFRLTKLKALSFKWKTHSNYLLTLLANIESKLNLELDTLILNLNKNKKNLNEKSKQSRTLLNILKLKYTLRKNISNLTCYSQRAETVFLNEKLHEIKLKWFQKESSKTVELDTLSFEKQRLLSILTKFTLALKCYSTQADKIKKIVLAGLFIYSKCRYLAKLGKPTGNNPELLSIKEKVHNHKLEIFLAKSVLTIKKLDNHLKKNNNTLTERLVSKINHITLLEWKLKQNFNFVTILTLLEASKSNSLKISDLSRNLLNILTTATFFTYFSNIKNCLYESSVSESLGKYAFLIRQKVINFNVSLTNDKSIIPNYSILNLVKKDYFINYLSALRLLNTAFSVGHSDTMLTETNSSKGLVLYKFSSILLNQRYKVNKILEIKLKNLLLKVKTEQQDNINSLLCSIQNLNNSLTRNTLFIQQLETWLVLLKKKLTENNSKNRNLLRTRIHKINCYLKKISLSISTHNQRSQTNETKLVNTLEKNFIFLNYNILKQKLIAELLQMQREQILSKTNQKINLSKITLVQIVKVLHNRISELQNTVNTESLEQTSFKKEQLKISRSAPSTKNPIQKTEERSATFFKSADFNEKNKLDIAKKEQSAENKVNFSKTLQLKATLQELLKTNYEKSFVVLQTRRKVSNSIINRLGGRRNYNQILEQEKSWQNPFEILNFSNFSSTNDQTSLIKLLEIVSQKIYERKPIKFILTRKQKFIAKKTIKKKLKQFLVLMAVKNNYTHLSSLKNIYNVPTLNKLCDNLTDLQTMPKVSVIELVKVRQPKQYAVCLANFVVENLEKRFSFRSTMKRAAEQAMSTANVKGIKIQISGRLNGAEIARTEWLREGVVPLQTLRANIDYSYKTAKTIYGILGVKVWLFKDTPANMS